MKCYLFTPKLFDLIAHFICHCQMQYPVFSPLVAVVEDIFNHEHIFILYFKLQICCFSETFTVTLQGDCFLFIQAFLLNRL